MVYISLTVAKYDCSVWKQDKKEDFVGRYTQMSKLFKMLLSHRMNVISKGDQIAYNPETQLHWRYDCKKAFSLFCDLGMTGLSRQTDSKKYIKKQYLITLTSQLVISDFTPCYCKT